ncbi:MAG: helicase-related protein [Bdellovibrionia bacterium]
MTLFRSEISPNLGLQPFGRIACFGLIAFYGIIAFSGPLSWASITLQPHQEFSSSYLVDHPEQKGLLLYHSMGSGKTFIALSAAEKKQGKEIILLVPDFLKSHWSSEMKKFGVKNPSRYHAVAFSESEKILKMDLSQSLVILDEAHKLISKIRNSFGSESERLIHLYEKLKSANQLLLLSGTPIFNDSLDLSYIANLIDPTHHYPIDQTDFKTEYMQIRPGTSFFRGFTSESNLMLIAVPQWVFFGSLLTFAQSNSLLIPLTGVLGSAIIPWINNEFPAYKVRFRELNPEAWREFTRKYVSFYQVQFDENEDYPKKIIHSKMVPYNDFQVDFFLNFMDQDLTPEELHVLLADEKSIHFQSLSKNYLTIHSSTLQKNLLANPQNGREIGNLESLDDQNHWVESPKFLEVLKKIKESPGQVAIYSNYDRNGIQRFARFLDRNGYKNQYVSITPDQSQEDQIRIMNEYNQAQKRILLIHPEITEGLSLRGTEQFHILEPITNSALEDQIIGRAIRYQSHAHLPADRRKVNIYLWASEVNYSYFCLLPDFCLPTKAGLIRREHWQHKYSEINPSQWTKGITDLDPSFSLKEETPDARTQRTRLNVQKDLRNLDELLRKASIESQVGINPARSEEK